MKSRYIDDIDLEFIRSAMTESEFLPFLVALETGLRIGDVLGLKHTDIRKGNVYFTAQKTGKRGVAKISKGLELALKKANGSVYCFPGRDKRKPLTRQAAWARIKKACERCGLDSEGVSPHSLRKVFAVDTFKTEGAEQARRALQHSDLRTTELYILSDWTTGKNADKPLTRKDISKIVEEIFEMLKMNVDKI